MALVGSIVMFVAAGWVAVLSRRPFAHVARLETASAAFLVTGLVVLGASLPV